LFVVDSHSPARAKCVATRQLLGAFFYAGLRQKKRQKTSSSKNKKVTGCFLFQHLEFLSDGRPLI
jgi:phosphatidylserine decarboxylase